MGGHRQILQARREDSTCPICAQRLGAALAAVFEVLDEQLESLRVDGRYFTARIDQLEQMPAELRTLFARRRQLLVDAGVSHFLSSSDVEKSEAAPDPVGPDAPPPEGLFDEEDQGLC